MTDHKPNHPHPSPSHPQGHFFNGLLVGLVLGIAIALLFTTKKGKKMVKSLTEDGLDSISELKKRLENIEGILDEEDSHEENYFEEADKTEKKNEVKTDAKIEIEEISDDLPEEKNPKRRFFKGIRKN